MRGRTVLFSALFLAVGVLPALADQTAPPADATQPAAPASPATPATSATPATPATGATAPVTDVAADDPIECRRLDAATGSRIGSRRVCMHQSEWAASEREAQQSVRASQQRVLKFNAVNPATAGGGN